MQYISGCSGFLENLYDETLLLDAFPNYTVLDIRTYTDVLQEGKCHRGTAALLGMVG